MLRGLYTAYTGMLNEQYRMDIMSNNLANADTTGFKKEGSTSQSYSDVMAVKNQGHNRISQYTQETWNHESWCEDWRNLYRF